MLTPREQTELTDEVIDRMFAEENDLVAELAEDGGFIGDILLPGPKRLDAYWAATPDLSDVPGLLDPNWESLIRRGLDPGPKNPYWKNLLREPGLLKEVSQDFVRLNKLYFEEGPNALA